VSETTKIQWAKHTASPWYGCQHAQLPDGSDHPGCPNCYAEALSRRNPGTLGEWGADGRRVVSKSFHDACRKWNAAALKAGERASVFPSLCDPFEDWQGPIHDHFGERLHRSIRGGIETQQVTMNDLRADLFATIDKCPMLDFLLLTKRPQNIQRFWTTVGGENAKRNWQFAEPCKEMPSHPKKYRRNVHLLYSASDQASLEAGIGELLKCRDLVPVLGLSLEPLVGLIDLDDAGAFRTNHGCDGAVPDPQCEVCHGALVGVDWVIVGGESGSGARPCRPEWIRSIVRQCKDANVPCFVKQLGSNIVTRNDMVEDHFNSLETGWPDPEVEHHIHGFREDYQGADCRIRLRDKKGGDWSEWPEDLRVRQFPQEAIA
jgi:protein gp37